MNIHEFSDLLEIIKNIIMIIGVIFGAAWTIIIYFHLKQPLKERLAIEKIQNDITREKSQPAISLNMDLNSLKAKEGYYLIFCDVVIENTGNLNTKLDVRKAPFAIYKIAFAKDGSPIPDLISWQKDIIQMPIEYSYITVADSIAYALSKKQFSFIAKVASQGTYMVEFTAALNESDKKIFEDISKKKIDGETYDAKWEVKKYIHLD